jgi:hypothetical protein
MRKGTVAISPATEEKLKSSQRIILAQESKLVSMGRKLFASG